MLALIAYARWVAAPSARSAAATVASFVFALLAKPMIVTLPLVLLALDCWPLRRVRDRRSFRRCAREKVPLLALSVAVGVLTIHAQVAGGAVGSLGETPLRLRAANAVVAYAGYLGAIVWPAHLAVLYPFPRSVPPAAVVGAATLLVAVTALAVATARRAPWLLVGWTWFVVMLLPVSGLAKVGQHASADRFTYLPSVGLLVAAVWSVHALARERVAAIGGAAVVVALAVATRRQLEFWRDDVSLWTRAVAVTSDHCIADVNLGSALVGRGDVGAARAHLDQAVRSCPEFAKAHANRGVVLDASGDAEGALAELDEAVRLDPAGSTGWYDRGVALAKRGDLEAARGSYATAVRLDPESVDAHANLAWTLASLGRRDEAVAEYRIALRLAPERTDLVAQLDAVQR